MTIKQISASAVALIICASASYGQDNNVITIESMKEPAMPIGQYNYREAKQISEDFKLRADSILNSVDYRSMKRPALGQWYIGKNAGDGFLPMRLMSYGNIDPEQAYESIKDRIYREVYGVAR